MGYFLSPFGLGFYLLGCCLLTVRHQPIEFLPVGRPERDEIKLLFVRRLIWSMLQNARGAGFSRLFHYETFNADFLADCLINRRVRCSDPANLNDPWDCRPWFNEQALADPKVLEEFVEWFCSFKPVAPIKEIIRRDADVRRSLLEKFSVDFMSAIPRRWRLYCLTPFPDSTLMWSHYADNHKGVCLEFSTDYDLFGSALEVQYLSSYPRWRPQALVGEEGANTLLTKADVWRYEREYRIVGMEPGSSDLLAGHPFELNRQFLSFPTGALQSVIVGCEAEFIRVKDVVTKSAPGLRIKRAVRSRTEYKLEVVEVV